MNFFNLLFLGKYGNYHKTNWYEALFAKVVGAGRKLIAKFLKIKGNTLVWNQTVQASNIVATKTVNDVTFTNNADGSVTMFGTASALIATQIATGVTLEQNHVYYLGKGSTWSFINGYGADGFGLIKHNRANASNIYVYISNGNSVNEKASVQCIDLTKMFGSTKADEIYAMEQAQSGSGVAYFRSLYPLPYYSYGQKLLSFNGSGIKTVGFNQWDEEWETGTLNSSTGLPISSSNQIRSKNYNPCISGLEYYFHSSKTDGGYQNIYYFAVFFYDSDKNFVSRAYSNRQTFTVPTNASYFKFTSNSNSVVYGNEYLNDICINISSSKNGTYEPYQTSTLDIPTSKYFPNGMKDTSPNVYDELTNSKAIKRVGYLVVNGTETWRSLGTNNRFYLQDYPADALKNDNALLKCNYYQSATKTEMQTTDKTICSDGGNGYPIVIRDTSYSTWAEFADHLASLYANGTPLEINYPLTEEQVVDIDPPLKLNYQVWEGGTEQLLPINTDNPTTSPILADIKYPDGERNDQYFTYRQYLPNSQMLGMALNTILGRSVTTDLTQEALDILMKGE